MTRDYDCPRCRGTGLEGRCAGCGGSGFFRDYLAYRESPPLPPLPQTSTRQEAPAPQQTVAIPLWLTSAGLPSAAPTAAQPTPLNNTPRMMTRSDRRLARAYPPGTPERQALEERQEARKRLARHEAEFVELIVARHGRRIRGRIEVPDGLLASPTDVAHLAAETNALLERCGAAFRRLRWFDRDECLLTHGSHIERLVRSADGEFAVAGTVALAPRPIATRTGRAAVDTSSRKPVSRTRSPRLPAAPSVPRAGKSASKAPQGPGSPPDALPESSLDERAMDATREGHAWRESGTGRWGSHPAHDAYDEESDA